MYEYASAYQQLKNHFGFKHAQRAKLDESPAYLDIMHAATWSDWETAEKLLVQAGIIEEK